MLVSGLEPTNPADPDFIFFPDYAGPHVGFHLFIWK
jgi:hypothetical protein